MARPVLNRPLVLEVPERTPDGAGGFVQVWVVRGTLWAAMNVRSGRDVGAAGLRLGRAGYRITVRAAPQDAPSRPEPGQRLRDGTRLFHILSVTESDAGPQYLTLWAEEEVVA